MLRFFPSRLFCAISFALLIGGCGPSPDELLASAQKHADQREYRAAVVELKSLLQSEPDNGRARWLLGTIYLELEDGASAEKEFQRAKTLGLNDDSILPLLAQSLVLQGKYAEVLELSEVPGLSDLSRSEILAAQGLAQLDAGRKEEADDDTKRAVALAPSSRFSAAARAQVMIANEMYEAAGKLLEELTRNHPDYGLAWSMSGDVAERAGDLEKAEQAYTTAIERRMVNAPDRLKRASLRLRREDLEGALADSTKLNEQLPKLQSAWYVTGLAHFRKRDYAQAQQALSRGYELEPNHVPTAVLLGLANLALGNLSQAAEQADRAFAVAPDLVAARLLAANVKLRTQQPEVAEQMARSVVNAYPENQTAIKLLVASLQAQKKNQEAVPYLEQIAAASPDELDLQVQVGLQLMRAKQPEKALDLLQRAAQAEPDAEQVNAALVIALLHQKKHPEALAAAEKYRAKSPGSIEAIRVLGLAQLASGDRDEAKQTFRAGLGLVPGEPEISVLLAEVLRNEGDSAAAGKLLDEARQKNPDHAGLLTASAELARGEGDVGTMKTLLRKAIEIAPQNMLPRILLANQLLFERDPRGVLSVLPEGADVRNPDILIQRAKAKQMLGQSGPALVDLERAADLRPDAAEAQILLAEAHVAGGDLEQAKRALDEAKRLAPDDPAIATARLPLLVDVGEIDEASRLFESLGLPEAHPSALAVQAALAKRDRRAGDWLRFSTQLQSVAPSSRNLLELVAAQLASSQPEAAERTLSEWAAAHPQDTPAALALAGLYARQGRGDQVVSVLRPLAERYPENPVILNNLAWWLRDSAPSEALAFAEKAHSIAPADPAVLDTYIVLLARSGQSERAMLVLESPASASLDPATLDALKRKASGGASPPR